MSEHPRQQSYGLSLRKQLNFPFILEKGILTFYQSVLAQEYSSKEIIEAIRAHVHSIPDDWKDDDWDHEEQAAMIEELIDKRPLVAGNTRMSEATCIELGIEPYEKKKRIDYYLLFQACINLLNRRRLLMKPDPTQELDHLELEKLAETEAR